MPFDQYHEPVNELSEEVRTFAPLIMSMIEEADAIDCFEQRMSVKKNDEAMAIIADAQAEEFKHFAMDLGFLVSRKPKWRVALRRILFKPGEIVKNANEAETLEDQTQGKVA